MREDGEEGGRMGVLEGNGDEGMEEEMCAI